jgi:GntR family transcriptional regulator
LFVSWYGLDTGKGIRVKGGNTVLQNRSLDKTVPIPLHYQLQMILEDEIKNGSYPIGSMLPPETEISKLFGISRTTVRQAIQALVNEKKLYRRKGKGTFVASPPVQQEFMNQLQFVDYDDMLASAGRTVRTEVLAFELVPMPEKLCELTRRWNDHSILLYRRRFVDDEPIVCVRSYFDAEQCAAILGHDFTVENVSDILFSDPQTRICRAKRICEAVGAEQEDAQLLRIPLGSPIQFITTFGYNGQNEILEYTLSRYRGDRNQFHVELTL